MTPNIAVVHIEFQHWRSLHLWLPLFLIWVPVILLSPFILLLVLAVCFALRVNPWRAIAAFWALSCGLPGTDVHVRAEGNNIRVKII